MDFGEKLGALVAKEAAGADPGKMAEILERLLHSAALTISLMSKGDAKAIDTLVAGAENYIAEEAAGLIPFGETMAVVSKKGGPPQ